MKKIRTQSDIEKSEKRKKLAVGFVLIFLMLFSTAGFALNGISNRGNSEQRNSGEPYNNGQYWVYQKNGQEFYFTYHLSEVRAVNFDFEKTLDNFEYSNLYVDSENPQMTQELSFNLGRFVDRFQEACYGECERDLPEKDCRENLIVLRNNELNEISQNENCIFIDGDLKTVDAFLYEILELN